MFLIAAFTLLIAAQAIPLDKQLSIVQCPDEKSQCPSVATCCAIDPSGYGCCPILNATCCEDKTHCCPSDYTCDPVTGACHMEGMPSFKMMKKQPAVVGITDCGDNKHYCPQDGATCCLLNDAYYCCNAGINASCCHNGAEMLGCCRHGMFCNYVKLTCDGVSLPAVSEPITKATPAMVITAKICDEQSKCPPGYKCNISKGTCDDSKSGQSIPMIPMW